MKRQFVIKDIEIEIVSSGDDYEGSISFSTYEDCECRHPSGPIYGFAGYGAEPFVEVIADFFSIFPVKNSAFIKGRKIEIESEEGKIISIKSLDTGRVFDTLKYRKDKSELSDYYS